jgi:hypothetical protein
VSSLSRSGRPDIQVCRQLYGILWRGEEPDHIQLTEDLHLVREPKILLSDSLRARLGTIAVEEITEAKWGLEYR